MPISDFSDLLPSEVQVERLASRDRYGNPTYGAPTTVAARISYSRRTVPNPGVPGEHLAISGTVWLAYTGEFTPEDRLLLPSGVSPEIVFVEQPEDETGIRHHTKVTFK